MRRDNGPFKSTVKAGEIPAPAAAAAQVTEFRLGPRAGGESKNEDGRGRGICQWFLAPTREKKPSASRFGTTGGDE